jgi:hypothetical protein
MSAAMGEKFPMKKKLFLHATLTMLNKNIL